MPQKRMYKLPAVGKKEEKKKNGSHKDERNIETDSRMFSLFHSRILAQQLDFSLLV